MRVAVIGGGPSGLVTLKYLLTAHNFSPVDPIEAVLFESEDSIGGTFKHRSYEDGELVSSKYLTTFSDFRYNETDPAKDPDFMSIPDYVDYLERYCTQFDLWRHIRLSTTVRQVRQAADGTHLVTVRGRGAEAIDEAVVFDAIAVCSGLHVTPNIPEIPGIDRVARVMHSSEFKFRADFGENKSVLILGSGETAMDLAHLAVTGPTKSVTMSYRTGFLAAPKRVPRPVVFGLNPPSPGDELNEPVDCSGAALLDTLFVHPKLEASTWLWNFYDGFTKTTLFLNYGSKYGVDQFVGGFPDDKYHASSVFFNKSSKAMPYISAPYRPMNFSARLKRKIISVPLEDTHGRQIDLAPWPERIDENGVVHFRDTGRPESERMKSIQVQPDVVVFCTGYNQRFPFLDETYASPETADVRRIWKSDQPTVGFIGFIRPGFGAIPPLSEMQAQLFVLNLLQTCEGALLPHPIRPTPLGPHPYYNLRVGNVPVGETVGVGGRKLTYGVDHESYAYQLALDMGSAPSFGAIVRRGPKMLLCWALAPNFNTKFRLEGPWRWTEGDGSGKSGDGHGADEVMEGELWETVARRGVFGNLMLSGLPILFFGYVSFILWVYWGIRGRLATALGTVLRLGRPRQHDSRGEYESIPAALPRKRIMLH